jgi:hypothetical protein
MKAESLRWGGAHLLFIVTMLALGEWLTAHRWLDPTFVGQPSGTRPKSPSSPRSRLESAQGSQSLQ